MSNWLRSVFVITLVAGGGILSIADAQAAAPDGGGVVSAIALIVGLLVIVGVAVKLYDLKRKRENEATHVQASISDALLRDERLFGVPVTTTAHVPFWSGSPVSVEVSGPVPTPQLRDAVLRIAQEEATRIRPDIEIRDRVTIAPAVRVA